MTYTEKFVIVNRLTERFTIQLLKNPEDILVKAALDSINSIRENLIKNPNFEIKVDLWNV